MNKDEAIRAMNNGFKVRHRFFSEHEWVRKETRNMYIYEDGVRHSTRAFWEIRENEKSWETDWEIINNV